MTQQTAILSLLRAHPEGLTTNDILASPYGLASEYRSRIAELRGQGYVITCEIHRGGGSVWRLMAEPPHVLPDGQLVLSGMGV